MKKQFILALFLVGYPAFSQSLEAYISTAKENSSKLKVAQSNYVLTQEKVQEVTNYDNTNFSFGVFALTPETRVGSQLFKAGISQKIPWFGTFNAQKESVVALSEVKQYDIALAELDIAYAVKKAYYEIYQQKAISKVLKKNKQILKTYEAMALAALANDRATMSDVMRIRVQINELHNKISQNSNSVGSMSRNFNRLLQREESIPINVVDSLSVLDIVIAKNPVTTHPGIQKLQSMDKVYLAQDRLVSINQKPKLTLGLDYILVNQRSDVAISQNGKDILMPKVALAIPVFNKKYESQHKQLSIQQDKLQEEITDLQYRLEIALTKEKLTLDNAVLSLESAQKNKTEIQRAIHVDLKAYETGMLDYDKILRLQLQKIKYELDEIKATKTAFIAQARIDYLTE